MDAGYLKREMGIPLRGCLAEVAEKRPHDPIEFISHWLYKFKANKICEEQKKQEALQLIQEQKDYELEMERREKMRLEAERLAALEAERKRAEEEQRAREAASASKLAVVVEGQEPGEDQPKARATMQTSQLRAKHRQKKGVRHKETRRHPKPLRRTLNSCLPSIHPVVPLWSMAEGLEAAEGLYSYLPFPLRPSYFGLWPVADAPTTLCVCVVCY